MVCKYSIDYRHLQRWTCIHIICIFQFIGITGWLIVGWMWKDWALIIVNTIGSLVLLIGIIHYHYHFRLDI